MNRAFSGLGFGGKPIAAARHVAARAMAALRPTDAVATSVADDRSLMLTALNSMRQGLVMFDKDLRLVVCNDQFLKMYDLPPEVATSRCTLREIVGHHFERSGFPGDFEAYVGGIEADCRGGRSVQKVVELNDGRVISITRNPTSSGGRISTHEDITRRRQNELRVREQRKLFDTALNNMSQGLVMFDKDLRVVVCNLRYREMYEIPDDMEIIGSSFRDILLYHMRDGVLEGSSEARADHIIKTLLEERELTRIIKTRGGRIFLVVNRLLEDGGRIATHEDITERHRLYEANIDAEAQLRAQKVQIDRALAHMSQGLCLYDTEARIVLFNQHFLDIYGMSPDVVKPGMTFVDMMRHRKAVGSMADDPEELAALVLESVRTGEARDHVMPMADGRHIRAFNRPLPDGSWVTTYDDVTDRIRSQLQLQDQKLRLDTALDNMTQGLNMFDAEGRLIVSNERYRRMYGLPADAIKPGMSIEDLVHLRVRAGTFFDVDPDAYILQLRNRLRERKPATAIMELTDGRTVSMHSQPTPDGQGWVVTHEDITERRRIEKERDRSTAFATSVIENVPATIIVKDVHSRRYVLINKAGESHYNITREGIIGKTANEVFPPSTAQFVREADDQVLEVGNAVMFDEHPSLTPQGQSRIVVTTRVPIFDDAGQPQYLLSVIEDRTNRKRAEARIAHLAHHDVLTGLPNRAAFNACLESTIETAYREASTFVLMSLDVSRLKEINDVFGYVTGDRLLAELSQRVQATIGGAFVARLGGDEFSVIATDGVQPQAAEEMAERLQRALSQEFIIDGKHVHSGISIGIAIYPQNGEDATTLVANADAALHRAKIEDRGGHRFFEADMDKRLRDRRALQQDLSEAIERGELSLHYQPQARIDGQVFGFEALARWNHPSRGNVSPGVFIPLAEESGLIIPIGEWILREACREAASWPKAINISVNLSPVQFRHGDVAALVHQVLVETGLAPQRLELEITEGVLIGDYSRALSILRRLKAMGVRIAMDDFGTGYSSLSYLQAFPFDKIKIDQTFVSNLESNAQSATIVRAVIGLARGFAVPVIAEGVETDAQLRLLSAEGCDEVQGYLIGRPQPIAEYASHVGRAIPLKRKIRRGAGAA